MQVGDKVLLRGLRSEGAARKVTGRAPTIGGCGQSAIREIGRGVPTAGEMADK